MKDRLHRKNVENLKVWFADRQGEVAGLEVKYDNRNIIADIIADTSSICMDIEAMDLEALAAFGAQRILRRMGTSFTRTGNDKEWRAKADLWERWAEKPRDQVDVEALTEESVYYTWCVSFRKLTMQM